MLMIRIPLITVATQNTQSDPHTYIHIYTHTYIHLYIYIYMDGCRCVGHSVWFVYIRMCIHTWMHIIVPHLGKPLSRLHQPRTIKIIFLYAKFASSISLDLVKKFIYLPFYFSLSQKKKYFQRFFFSQKKTKYFLHFFTFCNLLINSSKIHFT